MYIDIDSKKSISIMEMDAAAATSLHKALLHLHVTEPGLFQDLGLAALFRELTDNIKQLSHGN